MLLIRTKWFFLTVIGLLLLVIAGIYVNIAGSEKQERLDSALMTAIQRQDANTVQSLLQQGADPNTHNYTLTSEPHSFWRTLLAVLRGKPPSNNHPSPLFMALGVVEDDQGIAFSGPVWIVGNPNIKFDTKEPDLIIKALLDHGANFKERDEHENTPLLMAAQESRQNIVKLLLDRGADVNTTGAGFQESVLAAVVESDMNQDAVGITRFLLDKGAHMNAQDRAGMTPLMKVALHGDLKITQILLSRG